MNDQANMLRQRVLMKLAGQHPENVALHQAVDLSQVITITSGKGGVGKTNFAVNLALALSSLGKRVILLDADIGLANVDVLLGVSPPYNLSHVIRGEKTIQQVILQAPGNISLIAGGSGLTELLNITDWQLSRFIANMYTLAGQTDYILIDTGAGLSSNVLSFILAADESIIVTTPEPTSLADAYALIKVVSLKKPDIRMQLVVNRVENPREGDETANRLSQVAARFLNITLEHLGSIPADSHVVRAVKEQVPFTLAYPHCDAALAVRQVAARLCQLTLADTREHGLRAFIKRAIRLFR